MVTTQKSLCHQVSNSILQLLLVMCDSWGGGWQDTPPPPPTSSVFSVTSGGGSRINRSAKLLGWVLGATSKEPSAHFSSWAQV